MLPSAAASSGVGSRGDSRDAVVAVAVAIVVVALAR